ncbi:MAG TPA: DUF2934 domain-containing protein [Anaeromyxobacter sp.]|nr:DUF2934 domain-containing protein [Anaeromyxobacter sp.]
MATLKKKTEVTAARSVSAAARPAARRPEPSYEEISQRARQIWESSGCQPGNDLENWLRAERELRNGSPA